MRELPVIIFIYAGMAGFFVFATLFVLFRSIPILLDRATELRGRIVAAEGRVAIRRSSTRLSQT